MMPVLHLDLLFSTRCVVSLLQKVKPCVLNVMENEGNGAQYPYFIIMVASFRITFA